MRRVVTRGFSLKQTRRWQDSIETTTGQMFPFLRSVSNSGSLDGTAFPGGDAGHLEMGDEFGPSEKQTGPAGVLPRAPSTQK